MNKQKVVVTTTTVPASHRELREELERDVAKFLNEGGQVIIIEPGVSALDNLEDFAPYGDLRKVNKKIYSLIKEEEELLNEISDIS